MGRALVAVGVALGLFMAVFAGVVYVTRDEDLVAVDAVLAERLGRAFSEAEQLGRPLDLAAVTPFPWDRVVVFEPGTPRAEVSRALGFEWRGHLPYTAESSEVFVFLDGGRMARFADYRGRGRFEGLERPFAVLTPEEAVFRVRDGLAERRRGTRP